MSRQQPTLSESDVEMFIGWLSADIPELHNVEIPRLADSWDRFKAKAGIPDSADEGQS